MDGCRQPWFCPYTRLPRRGFSSAGTVALAGAALLVAPAPAQFQRIAQLAIGIGIVALMLAGQASIRLGIVVFKMPMAEVIAFALMGCMLIALHARRVPAEVVRLAWFAMIAAGLFGLASHFLEMGGIYSGDADFRIAALSSLALMACAGGIWKQCQHAAWRARFDVPRVDKKIALIGGLILLTIAISAGLAGFVLMADTTRAVLNNSLMISLEHRARSFETIINHAVESAVLASTRPRFNILIAKHLHETLNEDERQEVQKILDDIIKNTPITAIKVYDLNGKILGQRGTLTDAAPFQVTLAVEGVMTLLWKDAAV